MDQARQSRDAICDPTLPGDPRTQTRQLRLADEIGATPLIHNPVLNRGAIHVKPSEENPNLFRPVTGPDDLSYLPGTAFTAEEREEKKYATLFLPPGRDF